MCNIAGYSGSRQAAPILLEMLRREELFDGARCTGIATIHEGKIYWRKVVGDVETLIKTTDALYLPGTIGIAHSRPGGAPESWAHAHPFVTMDETMVGVTNGTTATHNYGSKAQEATKFLESLGYNFRDGAFIDCNFPVDKLGRHISCIETRLNMVHYHISQGLSIPDAIVNTTSHLFSDNVFVIMNTMTPDKIYATRTTRPMAAAVCDGETYIATTRFAFPDEVNEGNDVFQLPVMRCCEVTKDGVRVTDSRMKDCDIIQEMNPKGYIEAYKDIEEMLRGKKDAPLYFDDIEIALYKNREKYWPEECILCQNARLAYDILWQLHKEGRLKTEVRVLGEGDRARNRLYMWLED